jgi:hypothetical protein
VEIYQTQNHLVVTAYLLAIHSIQIPAVILAHHLAIYPVQSHPSVIVHQPAIHKTQTQAVVLADKGQRATQVANHLIQNRPIMIAHQLNH